jgi:hypothetical protein
VKYYEFRDFVLQLIDRFSADGAELLGNYNDQGDYMARIPGLLNSAMIDIAVNGQAFLGVMEPKNEDLEPLAGGFTSVKVPEDFQRMTGDGIPVVRQGRMTRIKGYYMAGKDRVLIRNDLMRDGILEYYRNPVMLDTAPGADIDDLELDGTLEAQMAAGYFVAAMLVLQDDSFAYAALRNEYDDRLTNMRKRLSAEHFYVTDVMGVEGLMQE